jgi:hypothetical protein
VGFLKTGTTFLIALDLFCTGVGIVLVVVILSGILVIVFICSIVGDIDLVSVSKTIGVMIDQNLSL